VGSLILIPIAFLPMTSFAFQGRGGVVAALRLPTRVLGALTLGPRDEAPTESALRAWAKIGIARIGDSPPKPVTWEVKLSNACNKICRV
jgi:hypothetical protein